MIVIEFLVFVISSGLFCSNRFRGNIYAVLIAGGLATATSLLFVYHVWAMLAFQPEAPVKVVKQVVHVPVVQKISQPPALSKPQDCHEDYPFWSRLFGDEGTTELAFQVLADGTVDGVSVANSSGSGRLDNAAVNCVKKWRYRPGIKDGQLTDMPMNVSVAWSLADPAETTEQTAEQTTEQTTEKE
ncbi:MAG TPA: energy transducer TonB [Rhizomicrobium sp.]